MTKQVLHFRDAGAHRNNRAPMRKSPVAKVVAAAAVAALASSVLAACGPSGSGTKDFGVAAGEAPEDISLVVRNDVDTFDPALTAAETGATQMYEPMGQQASRQ